MKFTPCNMYLNMDVNKSFIQYSLVRPYMMISSGISLKDCNLYVSSLDVVDLLG